MDAFYLEMLCLFRAFRFITLTVHWFWGTRNKFDYKPSVRGVVNSVITLFNQALKALLE